MKPWRALLSGLAGSPRSRRSGAHQTGSAPEDVFARADERPGEPPGALDLALNEIEAGALEVYEQAGLPTTPGHYRQEPKSDVWTLIGARITPEEKFALAMEHPVEDGWRFARLEDLGARSTRSDLRAASGRLNEIAELRAARRGVLTGDHLLIAMELGGAWRALRDMQALKASRLTLTPPDLPEAVETEAKPAPKKRSRARRDKTAKPR